MLRVAIGAMFAWIGYSYLFRDKEMVITQLKTKWSKFATPFLLFASVFYIITGGFLIAGLFTQGAAIAGAFIAIDALFVKFLYKDLDKVAKYSKMFYILILAISISLIFSGAGAFALDLPL